VKNIKKIVSAAVVMMVALTTAGCTMIAKTPEAIANTPVAIVNGERITKGELEKDPNTIALLAQVKQQYGDNYSQNQDAESAIKTQESQILDQMITEKVLYQKAKELNLLPADSKIKSEADAQIANIKKQQFGNDETKFQAALKQQNFTEASLEDMFISQLRNQEIQTNVSDSVTKNVQVTDKQIQDYYNANKYQYTEKPDTIHVAHILVNTLDQATSVEDRLKKGENFAKVAKEVSQDPGSKDKGGDLGTVPYVGSNLDATFMAAAIALKEGAISQPIKTQFGYHIIECIKKTEYPLKKLDTVKDQIKQQLETTQKNTVFQQKISDWKKAANITKYENNL
jgi:foldase protein PrsA